MARENHHLEKDKRNLVNQLFLCAIFNSYVKLPEGYNLAVSKVSMFIFHELGKAMNHRHSENLMGIFR